MPKRPWIAALTAWPGLPQIWAGQEVLGLALAAMFAASLNLALVARFLWTEAFAPGWADGFAAAACLIWTASLAYTLWWLWVRHPEGHRQEIDGLFCEATECYLQGRFAEARSRYERVVALDGRDADALMGLGTLFVRTEQRGLARRAFRHCLEADGGSKWRWEIEQALARLGDVAPGPAGPP